MDGDQGQGGYEAYGWGDYATSQDEMSADRQSPYAMGGDAGYYGAPYAVDNDSSPYAYAYGATEDNIYTNFQEAYGGEHGFGADPFNSEEPPSYQPVDTHENDNQPPEAPQPASTYTIPAENQEAPADVFFGDQFADAGEEIPRLDDPADDDQPPEAPQPASVSAAPVDIQDDMFGFGDNITDASRAIEPNGDFGFFGFDDVPSGSAAISEAQATDIPAFSDMTPAMPFEDNALSSASLHVSRISTPSEPVLVDIEASIGFALTPDTIGSAQAGDSAALLDHLRRVRKMLVIDQILRLRATVGADRIFRDIQPQQLISVESRDEISVAMPRDDSLQQILNEDQQVSQEVEPLRSFSNVEECMSEDATSKLQTEPDTERSVREAEAIMEDALVHTPEVKDLESLPDMETAPLSDAQDVLENVMAEEQLPEHLSNKMEQDSFERIQDSELVDEIRSELSQWGQQTQEGYGYADSVHRYATPDDSGVDEFSVTDVHDQDDQMASSEDLTTNRVATPDTFDDSAEHPESADVHQEELYEDKQQESRADEEELDDFDIEMARREAEMLEQARLEEEEMLRQAEEDLYRQEGEVEELEEKSDRVALSTEQDMQEDSLAVSRLDSPVASTLSVDDALSIDRLDTPVAEIYDTHEKDHADAKDKRHAAKQKREEKLSKHEPSKKKASVIKKKAKSSEEVKDTLEEKVGEADTPPKSRSTAKSASEISRTDKKHTKKQQKSKKSYVEPGSSISISSISESSQDEDIVSAKKLREEKRLQEKQRRHEEQLRKIEDQKKRQEEEELQRILAEEKLRMEKEIERATRKADREYRKLEMEKKRLAVSSQIGSHSAPSSAIDVSGNSLLSDRELMREIRLRERRDKELQALRHNIEASMEKESDSADYDPSLQMLSATRKHGHRATSTIIGSGKHKDSGRQVSLFVDASSYSNFYVKVLSHRTVIISGTRPFISYYIEFGMGGRRLHISCRFSEVKELHAAIAATYPATTLPNLPPDRPYALGGWKPEFIKERAKLLEAYLYSMHSITFVRTSNIYRQFLKAARC